MKLTEKWANALTYVAAYMGATPFLLAGGFLFLKSKSESVRANLKRALIVYLLILACNLGYSLLNQVSGLFDLDLYPVLNVIGHLIQLGTIITYFVCFVLALKNGGDEPAI